MFDNWINQPEKSSIGEQSIIIEAGPKTDFFRDPASSFQIGNAPLLNRSIPGDFTLSCRLKPTFGKVYDAGALMLYMADDRWIKFAFENTDLGYTSVVSVVTDEVSDDSNGEKVSSESVFLKISRKDRVVGLYYSLDGKSWKMVRMFRFFHDNEESVLAGIEAQSPLGEGCRVEFSDIVLEDKAVEDFRKGV